MFCSPFATRHSQLAIRLLLGTSVLLQPMVAIGEAAQQPYQKDFVLTSYYSPLPDQCCYVKGGLTEDKILNGNGTHGADGTPVYPGMIAAPKSYPFGTRIVLPGLGTFTVHDRGGAIIEQEKTDRLDVWAGHGEEGLARALEFGVQRIRGTVYLPGTAMPAESVDLASMPAPTAKLEPYLTVGLLDIRPKLGDQSLSVRILQQHLKDAGYFGHDVTGLFGDVTQQSLQTFLNEMNLDEPADNFTAKSAAYLLAAMKVGADERSIAMVTPESDAASIRKAQRFLRGLSLYRGRTNGTYDDTLFQAILAFQQQSGLVGDAESPGAGRIGPLTRSRLAIIRRQRSIAARAERLLLLKTVKDTLVERGQLLATTLEQGMTGASVEALQRMLVARGFFPEDKINGVFGPLTAQSVAAFQVAEKLLGSATELGAGRVGPITLKTLRTNEIMRAYNLVRAEGWERL